MKLRIALFILICILGASGPLMLFIPALTLYVLLYAGIEAILVAFVVDAYFGYGTLYPFLFTLATGVGVLIVEVMRPHISVYNR